MAHGNNPSLATTGLRKEFGAITAVDGVDLTMDGPQIVGVAGPNGAGKTVLLKLLLGLIRPTDGTSRINGVPSTELGPSERAQIGYMPQHTALYDDLTVQQNVAFFADLYDVSDRLAAVREVLRFVDLWDRRDDRIGSLSGGMIRRTSLAAAIVHDPAVLFLDEPTVGLDPKLRSAMWDSFRDRRDADTLIVVSTHYLGEVNRCDRVLFLRDGTVLAFDTPEAFLERTGTDDLEGAFLALLESSTPDSEASTRQGGET
ncbi:MAG: ABC transporter ATP-binding protein [Halobacteriales archaeon]